jgi:hypothetical protein
MQILCRLRSTVGVLFLCAVISPSVARAQCTTCDNFGEGTLWGSVTINPLTEASGLAASARNSGVLWIHNDGSRQRVYAFSTNGAHLANFNFSSTVDDVEAIAVGPGPATNISYIYLGDIGGSSEPTGVRNEVRILRIPEPFADLSWADNSRSTDLDGTETFTLVYPDGDYDAEALMVDPRTADVFVITKASLNARVYRANLKTSPAEPVTMQFVRSVNFGVVSDANISSDGTQIIFRRENFAMLWSRCHTESIGAALTRDGATVPVVGPPTEPNGEGIAFLNDGTGYVTVSEGANPGLYFFQAQCPGAPRFTLPLADRSGFIGGSATFNPFAVGYPAPNYQWFFNGTPLNGETGPSLTISPVTMSSGGQYQLTVSNATGSATSGALLTVRAQPDLRITEVQSSTAPGSSVPTADWWELTSFESEAVNIGGWRFNDNGGDLADPFTIPPGVSIGPGETVIFVENLSPVQFRNWWGAANLPAELQIISYSGSGLSLGAGGDGIRLWNDTTTTSADTIDSVDFGSAQNGITFNYNPDTGIFGVPSQDGLHGVFRAAASPGDIGSPGRIRRTAAPVTLTAHLAGTHVRIEFDAVAGGRYALEARESLSDGPWLPTGDMLQAAVTSPVFFEKDATAPMRFYRVVAE